MPHGGLVFLDAEHDAPTASVREGCHHLDTVRFDSAESPGSWLLNSTWWPSQRANSAALSGAVAVMQIGQLSKSSSASLGSRWRSSHTAAGSRSRASSSACGWPAVVLVRRETVHADHLPARNHVVVYTDAEGEVPEPERRFTWQSRRIAVEADSRVSIHPAICKPTIWKRNLDDGPRRGPTLRHPTIVPDGRSDLPQTVRQCSAAIGSHDGRQAGQDGAPKVRIWRSCLVLSL